MSLRQAARAQNVVGIVLGRQIRCICKGSCIDDRCGCRRAKQQCDVHCHKGNSSHKNH